MIKFMKRLLINLLLTAGFCALAIVILMPLRAELEFDAAGKFAAAYRWKDAEAAFSKAVKIDPFSAKYLAGFGDFLVAQSKYLDRKDPVLDRAQKLYEKALELNQRDAEYYLAIGLIELDKKSTDRAFRNFRKAAEFDPNGFNIAYQTGYTGISSWSEMNEPDKEFISDRLKHSLRIKPWYARRVYPKVWRVTKDFGLLQKITPDNFMAQKALYDFIISYNLWQFRKDQSAKVESYGLWEGKADRQAQVAKIKGAILESEKLSDANAWRMVNGKWQTVNGGETTIAGNKARAERRKQGTAAQADWAAVSKDGKDIRRNNGIMYANGTIYALIDIPAGEVSLTLEACGSSAGGIWPYMVVAMDGEEIGETFVDSTVWKECRFSINGPGGEKLIGVSFVNDGGGKGEDRNLFVGSAKVEAKVEAKAESPQPKPQP